MGLSLAMSFRNRSIVAISTLESEITGRRDGFEVMTPLPLACFFRIASPVFFILMKMQHTVATNIVAPTNGITAGIAKLNQETFKGVGLLSIMGLISFLQKIFGLAFFNI